MRIERADVVVVGCRPASASTSIALAQHGRKVWVKNASGDDALVRSRAEVGRTAIVRQRRSRSST
jgi:glycine/D-amino acid oxidase-like deaminating enzyme